jgi:uncharacterized membrane protein YwaF
VWPAYTALVGSVDAVTGANYMVLRAPPGEWTLPRVLGPWPWYRLRAAGVALAPFTLLDAPFWWPGRRRQGEQAEAVPPPPGTGPHRVGPRPSLGAR